MLLIISTFFGVYWLIQFRSFKKEEQAILQTSSTAKVIDLRQYLATKETKQHSPKVKFHTPIDLKKAK